MRQYVEFENYGYTVDVGSDFNIHCVNKWDIGREKYPLHSFDDEPAINYVGKNKNFNRYTSYWKHNNIFHREVGPALIGSHRVEWRQSNILHRYDGPAIMIGEFGFRPDWQHLNPWDQHWMIHGKKVSELDYKNWLDSMGMDIDNLSPEDKILIDLKWNQ